ncbi:MAG: hypothetical protein IJC73_01395 [Lentisphaeria bacterium]|nr:hypothetical protein [Lentisphaeria bacterium]
MLETIMADAIGVLQVLTYPGIALVLSLGLTYLCIRVLPILGFVDHGGGRHIHKGAIPRGGGIAVAVAFFVALAMAVPLASPFSTQRVFMRLFLPSLPIVILGVLDDRFDINAKLKLLVQILVGVMVWHFTPSEFSVFGWQCPAWLTLPFIVGWVILVVNAFNLIDGMDGLASGLAFISSCSMALWFLLANRSRPETLAMLILAGACLGFLRFNFHPARIFLGDTGSTFIGIIFAVIGISAMDRVVTFASLAIPVLAVGVPLFDVVLAVWRRSFRKLIDPEAGVSVMSADQDHLHHRLLRTEEYDQPRTAIRMYVICGVFSGLAMVLLLLRNSVPGIAYIIVLMVILLVVRKFATIELSDSARLIQQGVSRIRPGTFFGIFHPMLDGVLIFFSYVLVSYMTLGSVRLTVFVYMAAPILLIMWLGGIYKIYWLRCSIRSFFRLLITGFFAALIGQIVMYVLIHSGMYPEMFLTDRPFVIAAALFTLLMLGLILFERMCLYYATIFLFQQLHLENQVKGQIRPIAILLYGGGLHCRMYIKALYALSRDVQGERRRIVGILDDTKLLQGLFVCDFPVLGGVDDLDAILTRCHVDRVVVTTRIKPERLKKLRDVCAAHQVAIHKFEVLDTPLEDAAPVA